MNGGQDRQERPLDEALAEHLIDSQFPERAPARVTARYGGMDHHALEVDSGWIFRFPKRADCEPMLLRELKILPLVAGRIPVTVPRYRCIGKPTAEYPWAFAGYRKLAGTPVIDLSPGRIDLVDLESRLGQLLSALHGWRADAPGLAGVVRLDDFEDVETLRSETIDELAEFRDQLGGRVFERCLAFIADEGPSVPAEGLRSCLLHGDLSAEHLLVDNRGRLAGLIDWADACVGDPAYDFKFLWVWPGEEFVMRVLGRYEGGIDPGFLDRVRFYGACTAVGEVTYGISSGREANRRLGLAALGRAFAERPVP
jgi:aminoglycoside 2''-phosphotransferase